MDVRGYIDRTKGYDTFMLLGHAGVVIIRCPLPCKEERSERYRGPACNDGDKYLHISC